jgi:hypothetical protein
MKRSEFLKSHVARLMDQQVPVMAAIRFVNPEEDAYGMVRISVFFLSNSLKP